MTHPRIIEVTNRIIERSSGSRSAYMARINEMRNVGPSRPAMSCGNIAHAIAACNDSDKQKLNDEETINVAIVSAYNDMLSAHQPYHYMLDEIKAAITDAGGVAQMAGGVPAMCDGVTQGQAGMELSLFSRDVIAMATGVALSHNVFEAGILFGLCDKIVPGLLMGALSFGHLPFVFIPAGPMPTGISNAEKAKVRQLYAEGKATRDDLLASESKAYHSPGTCTFYGTANSNQMMLEMMGLQLPGSSFINPTDPLRKPVNDEAARQAIKLAKAGHTMADHVDEKAIVNAAIGLLATGGSTNHTIHLIAIARAAGIKLTWKDMSDLSSVVPLISRVYPNGTADINAFHNAGGTSFVMQRLLDEGRLHGDVPCVLEGKPLEEVVADPILKDNAVIWQEVAAEPGDAMIVRPVTDPFQPTGGLALMRGNIGEGVLKTSAVKPAHRVIEAPAVVFDDQDDMLTAFQNGELDKDFIAVIRFQGPKANGMPELHKLTPSLGVLQDRGFRVALVTDGRMSGASGKVPAAIHITPEALDGGNIGRVQTGDMMRLNANTGELEVIVEAEEFEARDIPTAPARSLTVGRNMFTPFQSLVGRASEGASVFDFD
ncbi:phosphogluconate dehydratase [Kordiimonas sp. SCSIO 12610]|uniref:phosphogluconate dehydratase n=1 Tax=Kordiimonas sp. SCSIO 12610 TaxID=2829597 RepID=UPI00210E96B3|nr:phosphogluconate dehydratase [Kordiimonas sp. SCSIO 12610]UTW55842.1 phosphogluconate dehydratase [Kordiimonas sp. SCSIO 12610]